MSASEPIGAEACELAAMNTELQQAETLLQALADILEGRSKARDVLGYNVRQPVCIFYEVVYSHSTKNRFVVQLKKARENGHDTRNLKMRYQSMQPKIQAMQGQGRERVQKGGGLVGDTAIVAIQAKHQVVAHILPFPDKQKKVDYSITVFIAPC